MSNDISNNDVIPNGALIGARFGPQGIVIGASVGGIVGFIFDD